MTQLITGNKERVMQDGPVIMLLLTLTNYYVPNTVLSASPVFVLHNIPRHMLFSFTNERTRPKVTNLVSAKTRKSNSRICALNILLLPDYVWLRVRTQCQK